MQCPRCRLPLRTAAYEGVEVDLCDACWGTWLDAGELEHVLLKTDYVFSDEEKSAILDLMEASSKGPTAPAPCPKCKKTMRRIHCDVLVHLVMDQCPDHGVWLDTGEIKKVQALAARSDEVHKMILRKVGVLRPA